MSNLNDTDRIERFLGIMANIIISLVIVGLLLFFIHLVKNYSHLHPASRVLVFILPFIWIGGLLIILKSPRWKIPLSLIVFCILLPVYSFEIFLWFMPPVPVPFNEKAKSQDFMDEWHHLLTQEKDVRVFITLTNLSSGYTFRNVFPMNIGNREIVPLSAASMKKTIMCRNDNAWAVYETDEHGFNNPTGLYRPGAVDMAVVGDSMTQGYCVPPDKNIPAQLRKVYPRTLNFGTGGAGTLTRLALFREYVEPLKPKVVLYIHWADTIGRIATEQELRPYLDDNFRQNLLALQPEIDEGYKKVMDVMEDQWRSKTLEEANQVRTQIIYKQVMDGIPIKKDLFKDLYPAVEASYTGARKQWLHMLFLEKTLGIISPALENFRQRNILRHEYLGILRKSLQYMDAKTKSWGGKFVFVYLYAPFDECRKMDDHNMIMSVVNPLAIPIIDLHGLFSDVKSYDQVFDVTSGHFNEYAYARVSDKIIEGLRNLNLSP